MKIRPSVIASVLSVLSGGSAFAANNCLDVQLSAPQTVLRGNVDVSIDVAVSNRCGHAVKVLRWQLPSDEVEGRLFQIERDGQAVTYLGPVFKRAKPTAADHVILAAGSTTHYTVELTGSYDLSQNGQYSISYLGRGERGVNTESLNSAALTLWLQERTEAASTSFAPAAIGTQATLSFTGKCTTTQKSTLTSAVTAATNYSVASTTYLSGAASGTPRYTTWFGAFSSGNWNIAKAHFTAARDAFQTKPITLDCSCKQSGTYAYVYPTQPYKIYVCGAFWNAPMTGTDSKGGTLVHEMMHFNVVAATDDWAYGQANAKALAISNPTKALDNSDSHEYFAENTPFQN
ncbi:MAG: peptidase M35 [Ideonella sp. MAG2]|nr:MAG: peptidase M35 [Ideonella sp. MAG2]